MIKLAQAIPPEVGEWRAPMPAGFSNIPTFLQHTLGWLLGFVGVFAVAAIIYSGIMYISAAGDTAQAEKAKKNLTWSIIGLVVVALSAVIIRLVNDIINGVNPT